MRPEQARPAAAAVQAPPQTQRPGSRPGRDRAPNRDTDWAQRDPFAAGADNEADLPPWAGPSIHATRAGGVKIRPPEADPDPDPATDAGQPGDPAPRRRGRSRAAATRLRKSQRRVYVYCGTAIVVAVVVAGVFALKLLSKPAPAGPGFITTLQKGEFAQVPSTCTATSPALIGQYLPGKVTTVNLAGTSATLSQCSFTVDSRPVFRVLEVTAQAYQPSALAGDGSATSNAKDAFLVDELGLRSPGRKSPLPPAQIGAAPGLGQQAFRAIQVIHRAGNVSDVVTVVTRVRNVVVTVSLQAQASGGGFGPVSLPSIEAGALAVAGDVLAKATAHS
jgi:hypothetical protein